MRGCMMDPNGCTKEDVTLLKDVSIEEEEDKNEDPQRARKSCLKACCSSLCRGCAGACNRVCLYFKSYRYLVFALIGGQLLSLLLCGTGVTSQALETFYNIAVPTSQLFLSYFVLALIFFPVLVVRTDFCTRLKDNWWRYLILGLVDVEANFLVVLAYKYTSLTSVQLLDSFTIVMVLVLSYIFLRVRYLILHLMGVAMCMIGIVSLVLVDLTSSRNTAGSDPILGDFLCLCGAVMYAISNVAQEYLVKNHSVLEWLGFIGFFGSFISGIQMCFFDRHAIANAHWTGESIGTLAVFVVCLFLFYTASPIVMKYSSAAVVNLSLLTADIFTLVFGIYLFKFKFTLLYVLAFIIIVVGIFIFNLKTPPVATPKPMFTKVKVKFKELARSIRLSRANSQTESANQYSNNNAVKKTTSERQNILARGPLEAALSSRSYSTQYSESMSYSYRTPHNK